MTSICTAGMECFLSQLGHLSHNADNLIYFMLNEEILTKFGFALNKNMAIYSTKHHRPKSSIICLILFFKCKDCYELKYLR